MKQFGNPEEFYFYQRKYWTWWKIERAKWRAKELMEWWGKEEDNGKQSATIQSNEKRL